MHDLEEHASIDDVERMNRALDAWHAAERAAQPKGGRK
jgi:hypothetical protein